MILLLLASPATLYSVTFLDESGINPLPAAIKYTITPVLSSVTGGGSGYMPTGATVNVPLVANQNYTVSFTGAQAPAASPYTFIAPAAAGAMNVTISDYRSPTFNQAWSANLQTQLWPRDWFGDTARASGGNAYTLASTGGYLDSTISAQTQAVDLAMRLDSSTGADIDSYSSDYLGASLPRNIQETDAAYIARIKANLSAKKGTTAGLLAVAQTYGIAWTSEPWISGQTGAWNQNGTIAWAGPAIYSGAIGGWGSQAPLIYVFIIPAVAQSGAQAAQMKSSILAAKPAGVQCYVVSVSGSNGTIL